MDQNATMTDFSIPDQIEDSIQELRFMPSQHNKFLASAGWDSKLRVWNINYNCQQNNPSQAHIQSQLASNTSLPEPLLSLAWQGETGNIYTGCADGSIYQIDLNNNGRQQLLGKHEAGCKSAIWLNNLNVLMTGGWDGKLSFWDLRSQNPFFQYNLGNKVYSMSATHPLLVVGLADRVVSYFNLNKLQTGNFQPDGTFESHLRYQTRRVATFPDNPLGYAIGSIEGRVAIKFIDLNKAPEINPETKSMNTRDDFAFRCHRSGDSNNEVYAVNDIAYNPAYGTFCTAGGDGSWIIWDKDSRSRLKQGMTQNKAPITAVDYSFNGDLLAYASGYDWAKGIAYETSFQPKLNIHYCPDSDKKKKPKK